METDKKLFVSLYSGRDHRDFIVSGLLLKLSKKFSKVYLFSPFNLDLKQYANVDLINYDGKLRGLNRFFLIFFELLFFNSNFSNTTHIKFRLDQKLFNEGSYTKNVWLLYFRLLISYFGFLNSKYFLTFIRKYDFFDSKKFTDLMDEIKPDIVLSSYSFGGSDILLLKSAQKKNIPLLAWIPSWDNLTSKGLFFAEPNKLLVWNEIMKKEAVDYHGFNKEDVYDVGNPLHDIYSNSTKTKKSFFFKKNKLDINKKLVTYAMGSPDLHGSQISNIREIEKVCNNESGYQILVRPYTHSMSAELIGEINQIESVIVQKQDEVSKSSSNESIWFPNEDNVNNYLDTLRYSDIIINIASTVTLDSALLGKRAIGFFNYKDNSLNPTNDKRFLFFSHYSKLVKYGKIDIFRNSVELAELISKISSKKSSPPKAFVNFFCGSKAINRKERLLKVLLNQNID